MASSADRERAHRVLVFCRQCPEQTAAEPACLSALDAEARALTLRRDSHPPRTYVFDGVFAPCAPQSQIFADVARPLVDDVLQGLNATCLAYGQTGTGKTHTMLGPLLAGLVDSGGSGSDDGGGGNGGRWSAAAASESAGIIPRCVARIFSELAAARAKGGGAEGVGTGVDASTGAGAGTGAGASAVDPLTLYRVLRALNPSPYMYLLDSVESQIVGASPEMLMRVHEGLVSTRPIAGTRARGASEADDRALEVELLQDEKEIAEHVMLVDLGRNDIGRVARPGTVVVERLAHIERFSHLMHLVSQVDGELRPGLDAFDAFDALFPAGTLTGAPKVRAMELIDDFEPVFRGPYGGAVGYFSLSGNADFAITIRTVSLRDGVATMQAGGGIVADSQPVFEYQESINKVSAPLLALEIADPSRS